jgi:outer membrane protein OmpA-like peptidoglycan-associated protein
MAFLCNSEWAKKCCCTESSTEVFTADVVTSAPPVPLISSQSTGIPSPTTDGATMEEPIGCVSSSADGKQSSAMQAAASMPFNNQESSFAGSSDLQASIDKVSVIHKLVFETREGLEDQLTDAGKQAAKALAPILKNQSFSAVKILGYCGPVKKTQWDEPGGEVKLSLRRARVAREEIEKVLREDNCLEGAAKMACKGEGHQPNKDSTRCEIVSCEIFEAEQIMSQNADSEKENNPLSALQRRLDKAMKEAGVMSRELGVSFDRGLPDASEEGKLAVAAAAEVLKESPALCIKILCRCEPQKGTSFEGPGKDVELCRLRVAAVKTMLQSMGVTNRIGAKAQGCEPGRAAACGVFACSVAEVEALEALSKQEEGRDECSKPQLHVDRVLKKGMPFKPHDARLTPAGKATATEIGQVLKGYPGFTVNIAGYTEDCKGTKWEGKEVDLGKQRAESVREVICGVGNLAISTSGRGFVDNRGPRCILTVIKAS